MDNQRTIEKRDVEKLRKLCALWGGELRTVPTDVFYKTVRAGDTTTPWGLKQTFTRRAWSEAPFTYEHAVNYRRGIILASDEHASPSAIIHEMGHVFVSLKPPRNSDEVTWFGWEMLLAKKLGFYELWFKDNQHYSLDNPETNSVDDFGWLEPREQQAAMKQCIALGKKIGCITPRLKPIPLRTRFAER